MAVTPVPSMTSIPAFPALSDRAAGTYNSKAYAFGTHMSVTFNGELLAVAANVLANATDAAASATTAGTHATNAGNSATTASTAADTATTKASEAVTFRNEAETFKNQAEAAAAAASGAAAFSDSNAIVKGSVDDTKRVRMEVDGLTTGATRVLTVPDADLTLVGTNTAQALTNKTLSDSTTYIADEADPTKRAQFQASGITTGTTRTYTLPNKSGTLATTEDLVSTALPYLHVRDEKASGAQGGTATTGSNTRVLNTVVTNTIAGASVASNTISLPAGSYRIVASAPVYAVGLHKCSLYNTADSVTAIVGTNGRSPSGSPAMTRSYVLGTFTIASTKTFTLRHHIESSTSFSTDLGSAVGNGMVEVYSEVEIWKEA